MSADILNSFADLVEIAGRAVRLCATAESLPQAALPESQSHLEQLRLERHVALAAVAGFVGEHAHTLLPSLSPQAPAEAFVSYTLPPAESDPPPTSPNPFLDRLGPLPGGRP